MAAAIQAFALSKRFAGVQAVDRLNLTVETGEIFGLVGPDGAGKTTTMRMLAGILAPDEGSAFVAGYDVVRDSEAVKNQISYMPQRFGLYEDLTVDENIRFYADLFGVDAKTRTEHAARLLQAAGMAEFRNRLAGKLSGGMKQKLGLTCALIHHPRVLLLDEPTTGVDPVSRRDFWQILYALLAEGVTILISTAYLDEAERCTRLALLHRGSTLMCDTPERLKSKMKGATLIVTSQQPREASEALSGADGISSLVLVGDGVHLVVDDPSRRRGEIRRRLEAAGVPFEEINASEPTIEDLFVASIERESPYAGQ
ncbi:MAG TPA: ABC transporter ATP-binding protein [Candidatus Binataceae bacterium]|nr:ABC transporter ATP-binding protein [Candidatus Binataceae bacterium]